MEKARCPVLISKMAAPREFRASMSSMGAEEKNVVYPPAVV